MPPNTIPRPGSTVAGHRLLRRVGEGGMGVVFEAEAPDGARVAVKLLRPERESDESAVRSFENEADATGSVDHENVVKVLGRGFADGFHYIVMEFVDGPPLHRLLHERGLLPWKDAAEITIKLARALACAHGKGLIHRDVKPDNVLLFKDGRTRLTDFGIVKDISSLRGFLLKGEQVGTAAYASPEQCQGKRLSVTTDMYSLGATLYHMVCGRPPFTGDTPNVVMAKHVKTAPIPPVRLAPELPKPLSNLIEHMLEKSPTERYPSMDRLIADLEVILDGRVAIGQSPRRSGSNPRRVSRPAKSPPEQKQEAEPLPAGAWVVIGLIAVAAILVVIAIAS